MIQPDAIPGCIGRSHRKRDAAGGSKGERERAKSDVRGAVGPGCHCVRYN